MPVFEFARPNYLTKAIGKWFKLDEAFAWCVTREWKRQVSA